jgi:hypothetical protein
MAEPNGNEQDARIRRIENEHDSFRRDMRNLLTSQVIQAGEIEELAVSIRHLKEKSIVEREERKAVDAALDKRVADLVSGIGELISRIPPGNLRG